MEICKNQCTPMDFTNAKISRNIFTLSTKRYSKDHKVYSLRKKIFDEFVDSLGGKRNFRVAELLVSLSHFGEQYVTGSNKVLGEYVGYSDSTLKRAVPDLDKRKLIKASYVTKFDRVLGKPKTLRVIKVLPKLILMFKEIREKTKLMYFNLSFRMTRSKNLKLINYLKRNSQQLTLKEDKVKTIIKRRILKKKLGYETYDQLIDHNCFDSQELRASLKLYLRVLNRRGDYIFNKELKDRIDKLAMLADNSIVDMIMIVKKSLIHNWTDFYPLNKPGINSKANNVRPGGGHPWSRKDQELYSFIKEKVRRENLAKREYKKSVTADLSLNPNLPEEFTHALIAKAKRKIVKKRLEAEKKTQPVINYADNREMVIVNTFEGCDRICEENSQKVDVIDKINVSRLKVAMRDPEICKALNDENVELTKELKEKLEAYYDILMARVPRLLKRKFESAEARDELEEIGKVVKKLMRILYSDNENNETENSQTEEYNQDASNLPIDALGCDESEKMIIDTTDEQKALKTQKNAPEIEEAKKRSDELMRMIPGLLARRAKGENVDSEITKIKDEMNKLDELISKKSN